MLNSSQISTSNESEVQYLKSEDAHRIKLNAIINKIYAATNLDELLIDLQEDITALFGVARMTIYIVDGIKRELVSRVKSGNDVSEIRLPLSTESVAGYSAFRQKVVNIRNVYDAAELAAIDPKLGFDNSWDKKGGFTTREMLAAPIIYRTFLLGAIQLVNRKEAQAFQLLHEHCLQELATNLGIAFYNQKRMAKTRANKFSYLVENNLISQKELDGALIDSRQRKEPIEAILISQHKVPKKEIGKSYSKFFKVKFEEYADNVPIPGELLVGLKVPFMRKNVWVPLRSEDGEVVIAIDNPNDLQRIDEIKSLFPGKTCKFCVAFHQDILNFIKRFTQDERDLAEIDEIISLLQNESEEIDEAESALDEQDSAVVQLVNKIVLDAHARGASDIHIEPYPGKQNTQVRIRVDGNCYLYQTIPYNYKSAVISRIKIMSDLDIAERRKPQDGKIRFKKYGGKDIELRVATVPTQGQLEDVVMRILQSGEPIPLNQMGFSKLNYQNFLSAITKPYGMILVCGPTGSGKTTTLHSAMGYINVPETKIWTAEDPVEITQAGLRQVQVQPKIGFDFAAAMRSFLRADPDVIMVGEMRDRETTHIGIEASLTGHLVLSTLHTNSAPESITRLLDMGMDPFNFADAILCILAQRLVLTLCKNCKEAYQPSREEYEALTREYGQELFEQNVGIPFSDSLTLYRPKGCDRCNQTGYRGRMGLHELLMGTDPMKKLIQNKAQMEDIRGQAIADGMSTLKQDGIEKLFAGHCDLIQVRKVTIK